MATTLESIRSNANIQVTLGLIFGFSFGFLLEKSSVVRYEVVIGQLLLTDFTVLKMMLSAVVVGTILYHLLKQIRLVRPHVVEGSLGSTVIGGLIFGAGFALLGYCPGTVAGAAGSGALDALIGGFTGLLIGSALYATFYPAIDARFLHLHPFRWQTLPQFLNMDERIVMAGIVLLLTALLFLLQYSGR